jgi:hypothetical protein
MNIASPTSWTRYEANHKTANVDEELRLGTLAAEEGS